MTDAHPLSHARLEKPRWPNGPKICSVANLPAFETQQALRAFLKSTAPSCKVIDEYQCTACSHWHADTIAPDPAGASSGQGRSSHYAAVNKITHLSQVIKEINREANVTR